MSTIATPRDMGARDAYQALAPAYDLLTGGYAYARWLDELERLALGHGLRGRRLLDVACGTGHSFMPMLERGYVVTACDISAAMLDHARAKAPGARIERADMRELPRYGAFDLVLCLDDALNYITDPEELTACFAGFARNLAPGGLAVFDMNTIAKYRGQFARQEIIADEDLYIGWRPAPSNAELAPGGLAELTVDVFAREPPDRWTHRRSVHHQRHWAPAAVISALDAAGLALAQLRGQLDGGRIAGALDESTQPKAVYVATLAPDHTGGRR